MRLSYGRHDNSHTCSAAATKLFDFELSLVIISPPQNSGPCNSFHYLGHSKNVYDDDDDDTCHR